MKLINTQELFDKADKVFPIRKWNYLYIPFIFIAIIYFSYLSINEGRTNDDFYSLRLKAKTEKIEQRQNGFHYRLDTTWYLIKHPIVNYIVLGDSIIKEPQSLHIQIKRQSKVKWDKEVRKNIIFRKVPM
jgi:hypothetical protein